MRSRSLWAAAAMVLVMLVGGAVLAIRGAAGREDQSVRFGVLADHSIGKLRPGHEACQSPVDLDRSIRTVGLAVDTENRPGPALTVSVRARATGRAIQSARVPAGYAIALKGFLPVILPKAVKGGQSVAVCARNTGKRALVLVGNESVAYSEAREGKKELAGDWGLFFPPGASFPPPESARRTYLQMIPDMLRRASVMRPGIVTPALYIVLAALLVVVGPALLWRAVVSADRDGDGDGDGAEGGSSIPTTPDRPPDDDASSRGAADGD